MVKRIVLFTIATLISISVGWIAYQFGDPYQPLTAGTTVAFLIGVWYCLLNRYPRGSYVRETLSESAKNGLLIGSVVTLIMMVGLFLETSPYNDGVRIRSLAGTAIIGVQIFGFMLICYITFVISYLITSGSRHLLDT